MIRGGSLRGGDKLPSVRALCQARSVSPSTVLRAYSMLELAGLIRPRPRSGYSLGQSEAAGAAVLHAEAEFHSRECERLGVRHLGRFAQS